MGHGRVGCFPGALAHGARRAAGGPEPAARSRADAKARLAGEAARLALVVAPLLVFAPVLGVVALLVWGRGLARRAWRLLVEPRVRERFFDGEVRRQVQQTLSDERSELEGRHARSLEHLAAGVAHEIRNPITAAKSLVQQMEEDPTAAENVEYARVALAELERVERSVSHLLRYAREEEARFAPVRLADVVDSALETFRERVARSRVELVRSVDCAGELVGDAEMLRRVVINLVGNALDAVADASGTAPRVEVAVGESLGGSEVWLRVRDDGPGMTREERERLWSPLASTKPGGTGLGLAITRKLVEAHAGRIDVASEPGRGAEFLVTLPARRAAAQARP
jgi:signal transduction histidine kinase